MKSKLFLLVGLTLLLISANGQISGDFRSTISGFWSDTTTWQRFNGSKWVAASTFPGFADGKITISSGDTVVSNAVVKVDQVVVNGGGTLLIKKDAPPSRLILHNGTGADLICNGTLFVDPLAEIINDTTPNSNIGTIIYNSSRLTSGGGIGPSVTFNGALMQRIVGNGYMGPIIVNCANNLEVSGSTSVRSIRFISGKILVRGSGKLLIDQYGNTFTGQNASRFIDGIVICIIYDTGKVSFSLPVGKGNNYSPLTFSVKQDAAVQTGFQINIVDSSPANRILPSSLDKVSLVRYFKIIRLSSLPSSNITESSLTLAYNASDSVKNIQNLRIAKSAANKWIDLGGTGSSVPAGFITSSLNFTSFGDFVLANAVGGGNPLIAPQKRNNISLFQNETLVTLYPNPVKNQLNVMLENKDRHDVEITIYDMQGKKILTKYSAPTKVDNINVDELQMGSYILVISDKKSGKIFTKKFIKN